MTIFLRRFDASLSMVLLREFWSRLPVVATVIGWLVVEVSLWPGWVEGQVSSPEVVVDDLRDTRHGVLLIVLFVGLVAHGITRVYRTHPLFHFQYRRWLALTPYDPSKRLPIGPVGIVWQDALILILFAAIAVFRGGMNPAVPVAWFLCGYYFAYAFVFFRTLQVGPCTVCLYTLSTALLLADSSLLAAVPLVTASYILRRPIQQSLVAAVWPADVGTEVWDEGALKRYNRGAVPGISVEGGDLKFVPQPWHLVGWPLAAMQPNPSPPFLPTVYGIGFAMWLGYTHYALVRFLRGDEDVMLVGGSFGMLITVFGLLARLGLYLPGHAPPVSLLGRFVTGRLLVPGYDRVWVAPALAVILGLIIPFNLRNSDGSLFYLHSLCVALSIMALCVIGPSYRNWELTAKRTLKPPASSKKQLIQS